MAAQAIVLLAHGHSSSVQPRMLRLCLHKRLRFENESRQVEKPLLADSHSTLRWTRKSILWLRRSFWCTSGSLSTLVCRTLAKRNRSPSAGSTEHIKLLSSQYEGLVESIADLEESLQKVRRRSPGSDNTSDMGDIQQQQKRSAISTTNTKSSQATSSLGAVSADIVQLEQDIKREELEILALQSQFAEQSAKKVSPPRAKSQTSH